MTVQFTPEVKLWLQWHYALTDAELEARFNERWGTATNAKALRSAGKRFGFKTGRDGRFVKGQQRPPGSGAQKGKPNATAFKKGNLPHNHQPVGTEITDTDGYLKVKVAEPNRWRYKQHLVWEEANGRPMPKGMVLRFLDGDKTNCAPDNLVLITNAEHLQLTRTGFNELPAELKPVAVTTAKLEVAIFRRRKQ